MSHRWTYFFSPDHAEGDPAHKDLIGAKGAGLAAMCKARLPVPPGFTISIPCCRYFLDHNGEWPEGLEAEVHEQIARLETITARSFGGQPPLLVSVRSGGAVSMPGMLDSILNCGLDPSHADAHGARFWPVYVQFMQLFGKTVADISAGDFETVRRELISELHSENRMPGEPDLRLLAQRYARLFALRTDKPFPETPWETLRQSIEAVFRSWNRARAIAYRIEHDVRGGDGTAVTVQAMFPSEVSGIVFTNNPANLHGQEIIIESAYGLGESVVSGDLHPDCFTLDRPTLTISRRVINHKARPITALGDALAARNPDAPSLTDAQIQELARFALATENCFGKPMDIEFGYAEGQFAILQARPLRGLDVLEDAELGRKEELYRLRELAGPRRQVWVAHSLGETLPAPTPLTWDIVREFMSGRGGMGRMYRALGHRPAALVCREGFLELIAGRVYADPDRAAGFFGAGLPFCHDPDAIIREPRLLDIAPATFALSRANALLLFEFPHMLRRICTGARRMQTMRQTAVTRFEQQVLPPYLDWVAAKRQQKLEMLATGEVHAELLARIYRVLHEFGGESLLPGFFGGLANASLHGTLTKLLGAESGTQLALTLTQGLEGETTIEQWGALSDVARGTRTLASFIEAYGHRTVEEMELSRPRWRENDAYLRHLIPLYQDPAARQPRELHQRNMQRRISAEQDLRATLRHAGGSCLYESVRADLTDAQRLLPYREAGRHYLMMGYETIRLAISELARRWNLGRDIYFLRLEELATCERRLDQLHPVIASRKLRWQSAQRLELPAAVDSRQLDAFGLPKPYDITREIQAKPIAAGVATGSARIVSNPLQARDLPHGSVLVCPFVDPSWTGLYVRAQALIVARGSVLSHAAIVARDFGIPALVCPDATRRIPDRAMLRVDGNRGRITFVEGN
ncbi:MAG: PEP/pyruvate-binding domain-containing protein [Kiritimatiellia bacterium]